MHSILERFNHFFELAPQRLLPWRWWVLSLFLITTAFMTTGMITRFTMDMSLESWFQDDDPATVALDKFRSQFGSDDGVYIVYRAKDGDVFSEQSLKTLRALYTELDNARVGLNKQQDEQNLLMRIERIDSLFNGRYQLADGDTLITKKLLADDFPQTKAEREARRDIAKTQDNFELAYYSKDFQYAGIRLKTDFGTIPVENTFNNQAVDETNLLADDSFDIDTEMTVDSSAEIETLQYQDMQMTEYLDFMTQLRQIAEKPQYSHFEFYYIGTAPLMEFFLNSMLRDIVLLSIMVMIIMGLLWILFRSFSAVVWSVVVIAGSAFWTIGMTSWLGIAMSTMVNLTFMLILAVGIADCVHVLSTYIFYRRAQHSHQQAMTMAYRKTGLPIFLTTITTMAGMSALMLSDIPQISTFGVMSTVGVGMAFILTIFVLPVLLDIWHPYHNKTSSNEDKRNKTVAKIKQHNKIHWLQQLLSHIPGFVNKAPRTIVFVYMAIFALFVYGTSQVKVDSNFVELVREGSVIRIAHDIVDKNMMGSQSMEFMLNFKQTDAVKDPAVLKTIEALQRHVEQNYPQHVIKTFSLADFVKDTNKIMNEGREAFKRIPDDARLTAQYIYLFDTANPTDRRNLVSDDYSKTHISLQLKNAGSYEYAHFFNAIQQDINRLFAPLKSKYPEMELNATGSLALLMKLIDKISWTQIKSFSFALMIITILMMVTLGSVQAGLISMLPNLLPAFFTFGLMGLIGVPLDTDTLVIAPLIIGIAVDDTIHFIAHYRDAWFQHGDVDKAIKSTIREVGQAVSFTTLILGVGFSVLAFSNYLGLAKTGIFGSMAIFVALSSDLLLLPALFKWLRPDLGRRRYLHKQTEAIPA
ncbi:MAG: MMPL family transporter [Pseudomonadales bacterium]